MKLLDNILPLAVAIQLRSREWTQTDLVGFALIFEVIFFIVLAVWKYRSVKRKRAATAVPDAIRHVQEEGAEHDAFEAKLRQKRT